MKTTAKTGRRTGSALAAAMLLSLAAGTARAGAAATPSPFLFSGSLELDGDSTLHRFSARTTDVRAVLEADGAAAPAPDVPALVRDGHVKSFVLVAPVEKLSSGDRALDRNMWKALKSERFKQIRFQAESFRLLPPAAPGAQFRLSMRGTLEVAGVARPIVLAADGFGIPGGVRIAGSTDLLMTDYAVKPPVLMFGAIKTANLVVVKFDMQMRAAAAR